MAADAGFKNRRGEGLVYIVAPPTSKPRVSSSTLVWPVRKMTGISQVAGSALRRSRPVAVHAGHHHVGEG